MATYTIYAGTDDGHIYSNNAAYATARTTSAGNDNTAVSLYCGQRLPGNFMNYRGFLNFDTSVIPNAHDIIDATMTLTVKSTALIDTDFDVSIAQCAWQGTWAANQEADFDAALAASTDCTWANTAAAAVDTPKAGPQLDLAYISKAGTTQYALLSAEDQNNSQPTDNECVIFHSFNAATAAYRPYLTITTAEPGEIVMERERVGELIRLRFLWVNHGHPFTWTLPEPLVGTLHAVVFDHADSSVSGSTAAHAAAPINRTPTRPITFAREIIVLPS